MSSLYAATLPPPDMNKGAWDAGAIDIVADVSRVFSRLALPRASIATLHYALCADTAMPWAKRNRGAPISIRKLAMMLADHGIANKLLRIDGSVARGYERQQFDRAWSSTSI